MSIPWPPTSYLYPTIPSSVQSQSSKGPSGVHSFSFDMDLLMRLPETLLPPLTSNTEYQPFLDKYSPRYGNLETNNLSLNSFSMSPNPHSLCAKGFEKGVSPWPFISVYSSSSFETITCKPPGLDYFIVNNSPIMYRNYFEPSMFSITIFHLEEGWGLRVDWSSEESLWHSKNGVSRYTYTRQCIKFLKKNNDKWHSPIYLCLFTFLVLFLVV